MAKEKIYCIKLTDVKGGELFQKIDIPSYVGTVKGIGLFVIPDKLLGIDYYQVGRISISFNNGKSHVLNDTTLYYEQKPFSDQAAYLKKYYTIGDFLMVNEKLKINAQMLLKYIEFDTTLPAVPGEFLHELGADNYSILIVLKYLKR